jgi:membrane protease subunit HflK
MPRLRYLLLVAAVAYLATGVHQIGADERAVVRRFGRVAARPGPGLWVGLPWGVDRVDRVRVRTVRQLVVGFNPDDDVSPAGGWLTGDQNLVDVRLVVEYSVGDESLDDYVTNRETAADVLAREVETAAGEWLAGRPVDEVLLTGRTTLPRRLTDVLPGRLAPHRVGLEVSRVSVDYLAAPAEVRDAFEAVNQAQTNVRTRENQARQRAAELLREAGAVRFRAEQQSEAYRREKLALAAADAEAFTKRLDQYRRLKATNPDVLGIIWWDEIGRTLGGMRGRGRIDLLDPHLGPDGLDVTQFVTPKKDGPR